MTSKLSISSYLRLIPCPRTKTTKNKHGKEVKKKINLFAIGWDHVRLFFCRLATYTFKTHKWPNVKWISKALIDDLSEISNGFINEKPNLPSCYSPEKVAMISKVLDRLKSRISNEDFTKIQRSLARIDSKAEEIEKRMKAPPSQTPPSSTELPQEETPLKFPLSEDQSLETLTPEVHKKYIECILEQQHKKTKNKPFFNEVARRFDISWKSAIPRAKELHSQFQKKHDLFSEICMIEKDKQIVRASLYQFQKAVELAKKDFRHLISLACDEGQRIKVARLIQIILLGEKAASAPLPPSEMCFTLHETYVLDGENLKAKKTAEIQIPIKTTLLDFQFENFAKPGEDKESLRSSIELFAKDFLERPRNFYIEIAHQPLVKDDTMFETIRKLYEQYLCDNHEKAIEIIENLKKSTVLKKILKFYPGTAQNITTSELPGQFLDQILDNLIAKYQNSEDSKMQVVERRLQQLKKNTRFSEEMIQKIANATQRSQQSIEPLMRVKFIELMLLLNQSIASKPREEVFIICKNASSSETVNLFPQASSLKFFFSRNLEDFEVRIPFLIKLDYNTLPDNFFAQEAPCAELSSTLTYQEEKLSLKKCASLTFGWLVPENGLIQLAKEIEPNILEMQPPYLKKKLQKCRNELAVIAKIEANHDIQLNAEGHFTSVSLKAWYRSRNPDPKNLEPLQAFFKNLFEFFDNYKKIRKKAGKEEKTLDFFRSAFSGVLNGLSNLQKTYEEKEGSPVVQALFKYVDDEYKKLITPSSA